MKSWLSDFVALWIPVKEDEEVHSWRVILFVLGFYAAIATICVMGGV